MYEEINLDTMISALTTHKGHRVVAVTYYGVVDPVNLSIECEDCNVVITDFDL